MKIPNYIPVCTVEPRSIRDIEVQTHNLLFNYAENNGWKEDLFLQLSDLGWIFRDVDIGLDNELCFRFYDSTYKSNSVEIVLYFELKYIDGEYILTRFEIYDD
jgi:hypothetical protein